MSVKNNEDHGQRAQTRAAREQIPVSDRLSFSPTEFAALNGKSPTWGYRRVYCGDVKVISDAGRILIPRGEVEKFFSRAVEYNPQSKSKSALAENGGEACPH